MLEHVATNCGLNELNVSTWPSVEDVVQLCQGESRGANRSIPGQDTEDSLKIDLFFFKRARHLVCSQSLFIKTEFPQVSTHLLFQCFP